MGDGTWDVGQSKESRGAKDAGAAGGLEPCNWLGTTVELRSLFSPVHIPCRHRVVTMYNSSKAWKSLSRFITSLDIRLVVIGSSMVR